MRSAIYRGRVGHERTAPQHHSFSYPFFYFAVDIDELSEQKLRFFPLFGSSYSLFTVRPDRYLSGGETPLRDRITEMLTAQNISEAPATITLLTMPRFCGYVFNPVSFYVCQRRDRSVLALVVEVNNTFGERHLYPLVVGEPSPPPVSFTFPKEFFVSPFFPVDGEYTLTLESFDERLDLRVDLRRSGEIAFRGSVTGDRHPLSFRSLIALLVGLPLVPLLTMARIHRQALILYSRRNAVINTKPIPQNHWTIRSAPGPLHRARLALLQFFQRRALASASKIATIAKESRKEDSENEYR